MKIKFDDAYNGFEVGMLASAFGLTKYYASRAEVIDPDTHEVTTIGISEFRADTFLAVKAMVDDYIAGVA